MSRAYLDSSALVKLSTAEPESLALIDHLERGGYEAATSVLSDVEVRRALRRLRTSRSELEEALRGFYLIDLTPAIRTLAAELGSLALRSLDAIHLATAVIVDRDAQFITYDQRLAAAAKEQGLRVFQPGR